MSDNDDLNAAMKRLAVAAGRVSRHLGAQAVMGRACQMDTHEFRDYLATCSPAVRGTAYHAAKCIIDACDAYWSDPDEFLKLAR